MSYTKADALSLVKLNVQELEELLKDLSLEEPFSIADIELILEQSKEWPNTAKNKAPKQDPNTSLASEQVEDQEPKEPEKPTTEPQTAYLIEQIKEKDRQIQRLQDLLEQLNQTNQALVTSNHFLSNPQPTTVQNEQPTYEVPTDQVPHKSKLRQILDILFS